MSTEISNISIDQQIVTYHRIDRLLGEYYQRFGIKDYYSKQHTSGKFLHFIESEEMIDDDISIDNELGHYSNPYDCIFIQFDLQNFPIAPDLLQYDYKYVIFYVLQYCYQNKMVPTDKWIESKLNAIQNEISFTCKFVSECPCFSRIKTNINRYKNENENITILHIVNDFIHLIHEHDDDQSFEYIYNEFGSKSCNLQKCSIYRRINQRNITDTESANQCVIDMMKQQIFDKIHIYYQHSYDHGYRLRMSDKQKIEMQTIDDEKIIPNLLCTQSDKLIQINQLLTNSRQNLEIIEHRLNKKYNSLFHQKSKTDVEEKVSQNNGLYNFGFHFIYEDQNDYNHDDDVIFVKPKYETFKQELILNDISNISLSQFNIENAKASVHFETVYCKKSFMEQQVEHAYQDWNFFVECVLSLMIYCNFTELQYHFTKTYRTANGNKHWNFYHLGKSLNIAINKFGTRICYGKQHSFYHGIGEKLIFPQYIGTFGTGVSINSPLSTSSSFWVATQFTNNSNGLVIEFGDIDVVYSTNYFSVSWLSDYANESEYLFIQNDAIDGRLILRNIFDLESGHEYKQLLMGLMTIQQIACPSLMMSVLAMSNDKFISNRSNSYQKNWPKNLAMATVIFEQLRSKSSNTFRMHQYAYKLIQTYFKNQTFLKLDYKMLKRFSTKLLQLFFHSEYQWIKLQEIYDLFPNVQVFNVHNIDLCSLTMDNILEYLCNLPNNSAIHHIFIKTNKNCEFTVQNAIQKYIKQFQRIHYTMTCTSNLSLSIKYAVDVKQHERKEIQMNEKLYIGNFHRLAQKSEIDISKPNHVHIWTMFISTSSRKLIEPRSIKQVVYHLHPTFHPSISVVKNPPFKLTKQGWGQFVIFVNIKFHKKYNQKDVLCYYMLNFENDCSVMEVTESQVPNIY
eukprot:197525_1